MAVVPIETPALLTVTVPVLTVPVPKVLAPPGIPEVWQVAEYLTVKLAILPSATVPDLVNFMAVTLVEEVLRSIWK